MATIMPDIEALLNRWQSAGVLDAETARRIRAHEAQHDSALSETSAAHRETPTGLRWQGATALILGAILLACGVVLFVSAHWEELGPTARLLLVFLMLAVFHLAGGIMRSNSPALSSALHAVGTVSAGAAIALVGQIFNMQEHWPAAVLLWAIAALFGWMLLRDQAQQTLALLLVPAWILCELGDRMSDYIGSDAYLGRMLFVGSVLYVTFFLNSRRRPDRRPDQRADQRVVRGILFAVGAIGLVVGIVLMLQNWKSPSSAQIFIPFGIRVWAWIAIAVVPLIVAAFHGHKGLIPIAAAVAFSLALPWCYRTSTQTFFMGKGRTATYTFTQPNLAAHALVAAFALFLCLWGVRTVSRALVNLGIVGFAVAVVWFYFSDIFSKVGRSLGLIGLGLLFLAGGWALERTRRRILSGMNQKKTDTKSVATSLPTDSERGAQ